MVTLAAPSAATAYPSAPPAGTQVDGPGPPEEYHVGDVGVADDDVEDNVEHCFPKVSSPGTPWHCLTSTRPGPSSTIIPFLPSFHPSLTCPPCRITSPMVRLLRAHLLRHQLKTPMTTTFLLLLLPGKHSAVYKQRQVKDKPLTFRWIDSNGSSLTSPPTTWPLPTRIRRRRRTSGGRNPLRTDLSFTSTITTSSSSSPLRLDLASSQPSSLAASAATSPTASTSSNSTSPRVLDMEMDPISPGRLRFLVCTRSWAPRSP